MWIVIKYTCDSLTFLRNENSYVNVSKRKRTMHGKCDFLLFRIDNSSIVKVVIKKGNMKVHIKSEAANERSDRGRIKVNSF